MALPAGLATVQVSLGPYTDAEGAPYSGTVAFQPSTPVTWQATGAVVLSGTVYVTLNAAGAATVTLPATDAAGLSVTGFTYAVSFNLKSSGGDAQEIVPTLIQLPQAVPVVDLDLLVGMATSTGVTVHAPAVISVAGVTGAVTGAQILADATVAAALAGKASTTALAAETTRAQTAEAALAPLSSPALTGTPTAPTPAAADNSTRIATTAWVAAYLDQGSL